MKKTKLSKATDVIEHYCLDKLTTRALVVVLATLRRKQN